MAKARRTHQRSDLCPGPPISFHCCGAGTHVDISTTLAQVLDERCISCDGKSAQQMQHSRGSTKEQSTKEKSTKEKDQEEKQMEEEGDTARGEGPATV